MEGGYRQQEAEELRDGGETEKNGIGYESDNPNYEDHKSNLEAQQDDDDWEAIADRSLDGLLSPLSLPDVSNLSLNKAQVQGIKRRGRGTFSYMKDALYSDEPMPGCTEDTEDSPSQAREPALEASLCAKGQFRVRALDETDELLSSIPPRDFEPCPMRPKTSARTAQRLIAQSMGIKLPSTTFGSEELRKQEAARKNRIVTRQHMRDDAWGDDAN